MSQDLAGGVNKNSKNTMNSKLPDALDLFERDLAEKLTGRKVRRSMKIEVTAVLPGQRCAPSPTMMVAAARLHFACSGCEVGNERKKMERKACSVGCVAIFVGAKR